MESPNIIISYDVDEIIASSNIIKNYEPNDIMTKYNEVQQIQNALENANEIRAKLTYELFRMCLSENGKVFLEKDKKFRDNIEKEVYSAIWYIKNSRDVYIQLEFKLATYILSHIINNIYIQETSCFWRTFCPYPMSYWGCCGC